MSCALRLEEPSVGRLTLALPSVDEMTSVPPFSVRELFPQQLGQFFRYNGSLTTPPCYQSVLWTVFHRRAQISTGQVSAGEAKSGLSQTLAQAPE